MFCAYRLLTLIVIFIFFNSSFSLKYSITENHNIKVEPFKTPINKRHVSEFFDKASYSFNGLQKIESIPIAFPLDICIFEVDSVRYAACLHIDKNAVRNFVIFNTNNGTYDELFTLQTPLAIGMDCKSFGQKGFVALAYNLTTSVERANEGSPIFQIDSGRIKTIQYFGSQNLRAVYLRTTANELFFLQTYENAINTTLFCPYFKWSGYGFNKLGKIPCSNARRLEPFAIDSESYIAVANYADKFGRTATKSEIYKYDREKKKLVSFQKIKTYGAVDVKYFSVPFDEVKKHHFLIIGNSLADGPNRNDLMDANSVIYKYERGTFVPYQSLPLYSVQAFLPVENIEQEKFILLVACSNQVIKIYNMNDWKFEESKVQFTEGAFGKGVSNMRIFNDDDKSYLVIANERMLENETNVFLPIFTQEEHANSLRQEIIEWTLSAINRLSRVDVEKLKNDVLEAAKLKKDHTFSEVTEIPSANVEIAYTHSLINPQRNFTTGYWKTLSYAQQSIEVLEARLNKKSALKRDVSVQKKSEYVQDTLNVGTLVIRNKLRAKKVNGIDIANMQLKRVSASKVIVNGDFQRPPEARSDTTPEFLDSLSVDHLKISGKLNDISWPELQSNTLKKTGQQFLKAPVMINTLEANSMFVTSGMMNDRPLSNLIRTDGGSYVINQDIQFAKGVYAKNLTINDRFNNIHVLHNKLDVLLLDSDQTQHITGRKTFENVKILEPVTISGKMFGNLDLMSPFKPIHDSVSLNGDYVITGDVTIGQLLSAKNIIGASGALSIKMALDQGIHASGSGLEGLKLNFEQPIDANNSILTILNGINAQQLVPTGSDDVQIIDGHKIFKGDLIVSKGFAEVRVLNGIDVDILEKRVLTNNGQQNITGNMKFKKVVANRITSPSILLQGKDLSEYLTTSGDQVSEGSLKVQKFETQFAAVENLQTQHKLFESHISSLNQKDVVPNPDVFKNYPGSIQVNNLKISGFINEKPIEEVERLLTQLNGNVKYVGGMKFPKNMLVKNLTFTGKLNGIPAEEFGNCWLQQDRDQIFTAPQTFSSISVDKGLKLNGKLNDREFQEFISGTYLINRDEYISNAVFENTVGVEAALKATTVNGLQIPDDILTKDSTKPQIVNEAIICKKDIFVKGQIRKLSTINRLNLGTLNDYLEEDLDTLTVQNVVFEKPPEFNTLNSHSLKKVMESVWFANQDVDLQHHVEIADGFFEGPMSFEGPINGMNLNFLKENYFSLSKPQEVSAEMIFSKPVVFENDFDVHDLHLYGPIIETSSNFEIDFNELVEKSLLTSGVQHITGQWKIYEAVVKGDLSNVRVNNLNLVDDVVRLETAHTEIKAPKTVQSASIKHLYCQPASSINGVDLTEWISSTVFVYENYTIRGKTTVDSAILYSDIDVSGTVNDIIFDEQNLLLRNKEQVIHGDVRIINKFPDEKRIISNSFEQLNVESVNDLNINQFFGNQAFAEGKQVSIESSITFENALNVENFESEEELMNSKESIFHYNQIQNKTTNAFNQLNKIIERIGTSYKETKYYLSHFEQKQSMHVRANDVVSLTLKIGNEFVDVIGILKDNDDDNVIFYRWDFYQQAFVIDKHLSWLPNRKTLIDIFRVAFGNAEYVSIEKSLDKDFYSNIMSTESQGLEAAFKSNNSKMMESLELDGNHCFVAYSGSDAVLSVFCVEFTEKGLIFVHNNDINREGVVQIASLEKNFIVLLLNDSVEIWKPNEPGQCKQKIPAVTPSQIATVVTADSVKYIAICSKIKPKSFHHGSVDIYKSTEGSPFELMQTIDVVSPLQVEFALIPESQDILLNILTESFDEPLAIYQYKGVVGFQSIITSSTITPGTSISIIQLKASQQHLIAVISKEDISFIEVVLHKN